MKKQLLIIGIIAILVSVGLSGCNQITNPGINLTNIGDIAANPQKYVNKEVTIEGLCQVNTIIDDNGHLIFYKYSTMLWGRYRLTGTIFIHQPYTNLTTVTINVITADAI